MNPPSSRLLKIPTIATSISTPNLTQLERKCSLARSSDDAVTSNATAISFNLTTLEEEVEHSGISVSVVPPLPLRGGSEMISSSAPGSLQSSPRNRSPRSYVPLAATPEAVDRPRYANVLVLVYRLGRGNCYVDFSHKIDNILLIYLVFFVSFDRIAQYIHHVCCLNIINRTLPPKNAAELQKHIKEYEEISKQIKKASKLVGRKK
jgi:hypothetical protein